MLPRWSEKLCFVLAFIFFSSSALTWALVDMSGAHTADHTESSSTVEHVTPTIVPPPPEVNVSVSPASSAISSGGTEQFWASVSGAENKNVTWKATLGTISAQGFYVAPQSTTQVVDTITVASIADGSKIATATVTVSSQGSVTQTIPASFFGLHINQLNIPWPTVPFASYRSLDSGDIMWADINPQEGIYNWRHVDPWIAKARTGGQDIMFTLFATPSWASSRGAKSVNPNGKCALASRNGPGVCDAPDDLNPDGTGTNQHWKEYVSAMINHVGPGTVKYWEVWNEWNISNQWNGTPAQMLRMAQDAYAILKAADPNALVTSPPVVNTQLAAKNWLLPYFQAGGGEYADIIAVHGYVSNPYTVCPQSCPVPENIAAILDSVREVMAATGQQDKPLFDTEGSWGVSARMNDREQQAEFTARFYLIQLGGTTASRGFDKFYWFGWDYSNTGEFYNPYTRQMTPAGVAYQQIYNWSKDAVMSRCAPSGTRWSCGFTRSGGYEAEAIWDTSQNCVKATCTALNVSVDPKYIQYRDLTGQVTTIINNTVPVGGRPILLENHSLN